MSRVYWKQLRASLTRVTGKPLVRRLVAALLVLPAILFIARQTWRNWGQIRNYQWHLQPGLLALGFLAYWAALLCLLLAWNFLMARLGGIARFRANARLYCVSGLSKRLPGYIWHMAGRSYLYRQQGVPVSKTLAGMGLETTLTVAAGLLMYLLTLPFAGAAGSTPLRLGLALSLLLPTVLVLQPPVFNRVFAFVLRRLGSDAQIRISYRDLGFPVGVYLLTWVIGGVSLYMVIRSVYPLPWQQLPAVICVWAASATMAILAGIVGLAVREVAVSILLGLLIPQPLPIVVAVLFWFFHAAGDLSSAGIFFLLSREGKGLADSTPANSNGREQPEEGLAAGAQGKPDGGQGGRK